MIFEQPITIKYYFHDLDESQENHHISSLKELSTFFTQKEFSPGVDFSAAFGEEEHLIRSSLDIDAKTLKEMIGRASSTHYKLKPIDVLHPFSDGPLAIFCSAGSKFAELSREDNADAVWGATCNRIAFIYSHFNKYLVWHEIFHTLGADDCYHLLDHGPTCNLDKCIMQYAPTGLNVGDAPLLCENNRKLIRSGIANIAGVQSVL